MALEIREIGPESLDEYLRIPISFRVESVLRVELIEGGLGGLTLTETPVEKPYVKDYDECVLSRPEQIDPRHWHLLMAFDGDAPVGGAAVAIDEAGINPLNCRNDVAVLWDIRVQPERRGQGIGPALFGRAAAWAREQGRRLLAAETQNVNVPACRFYSRMGCSLGLISPCAYGSDPRVAHEAMLVWCLDL